MMINLRKPFMIFIISCLVCLFGCTPINNQKISVQNESIIQVKNESMANVSETITPNDITKTVKEETEQTTTEMQTEPDIEPPRIFGTDIIYTSIGATVRYKEYITVDDNISNNIHIEIDNSDVNLAKIGEYSVIYHATDEAGNTSSITTNVIVQEQRETDYDDATIYAKADEILDRIILDDMTDLEKVFAVFYYVRDTSGYTVGKEKWSYKQEAYYLMTELTGTCYSNSCLSQLLLERLGIDSMMVIGDKSSKGYHYWNIVSLDNGKNWYIYDSIWMTTIDEYPLCMITGSHAAEIAGQYNYSYNTDGEYPTVSEEEIWTIEDFENNSYLQPERDFLQTY